MYAFNVQSIQNKSVAALRCVYTNSATNHRVLSRYAHIAQAHTHYRVAHLRKFMMIGRHRFYRPNRQFSVWLRGGTGDQIG